MNNLQNMYDNHNKVLLKHEEIIRDMVTTQIYETKTTSFEKTVDAKVDTALFQFNENLNFKLHK